MKKEKTITLLYLIIGIVMGYVSFLLKNNLMSVAVAIIVLVVVAEILKRAFNIKEKLTWFLSNGGWIYIFIWFVTWIIFYNL